MKISATDASQQFLLERYQRIRQDSVDLCMPLQIEDYVIQTAVEASPPKWHLAHTTWFFETFILSEYVPDYRPFDPKYRYLFNSYYEQIEDGIFPRPQRGLLSRPTVEEVYRYRDFVDAQMLSLLDRHMATNNQWSDIAQRLTIGLHHEQQHQELLLTDIKYNLGFNPLRPAYRDDLPIADDGPVSVLAWVAFESGIGEIGHAAGGFAFDNEIPRHRVFQAPFRLASRPISNGEFLEFIESGGYQNPALWLADGWKLVQEQKWAAPLYWEKIDSDWWLYSLGGMRPMREQEPVCHVSYYEAEAFAAWKAKRLPTEAEWELAAASHSLAGNLRDSDLLHPSPALGGAGLRQLFGDVWEWTRSSYQPYPGYRRAHGALGEYNGKFMCNQLVLRGGSCVTANDHIRLTYRNFFYPHERWQFKGFRLAEDV